MIQSDTIKELFAVYKKAEKCYKSKEGMTFYKCLSNHISQHLVQFKNKNIVLKQYEMSCKSYLESDILNFNISVGAFMISIITLSGVYFKVLGIGLACVIAVFAGGWTIFHHIKDRKLREILFVIENLKEKTFKGGER